MKTKLLILALALACACGFASAQNRKALRINEVMVVNDSTSIVDDYGQYSPWIELFNANFAPLQISSVYLSNDAEAITHAIADKNGKAPLNCKLYPVPLGDERTKIGKRQTVVFFADEQPNRGTFHTNFTLKAGQDNLLAIFDADSTLIDYICVPAALPANASYALIGFDDNGEEIWEVRDGDERYITPGGENTIRDTNSKITKFAEKDPHGFTMAIMAMCIVFSALLILCIAFMAISKIGAGLASRNKAKSQGKTVKEIVSEGDAHDSGEVIAAISMALYQHLNAHDTESTILTINKVKRAYSPWSSKIYGMRHTPGKSL